MGKDQDFIQAVKDHDPAALQKLLHKAEKSGKKLLGSMKRYNVNYQDGDGMCALHQAALMGNLEMMQLLLDHGAAVDLKDNKGMLPLHYAAWQGKPQPVHMLLHWKSPVHEQSHEGATPLHLACQHDNFDVVNILLRHHANPTINNKEFKSPLDLACEFGRYRVVDLLLRSNMCAPLLVDSPNDMQDNTRTTCLHLAAKNGHIEIIRLLLQAGVNKNRMTLRGTALHEAALCGKTEVVRLLLDCGVDVNKPNSFDQTALDIVNTYTTSRAAKDLKRLLKEAGLAVQARAIKDYCNIYDAQTVAFKEGDILKVTERNEDGLWKGFVISNGRMAKPGYFPSDHVVIIDSQAFSNHYNHHSNRKSFSQVPDLLNRSHGHLHHANSENSMFASIGADESFPPPPSHLVSPKSPKDANHHQPQDISVFNSGYYPSPSYNSQPPSYQYYQQNSPNANSSSTKYMVNHVGPEHSGDWSYVPYPVVSDMRATSPSKGSPTNSNRNSVASSDSGRGTGHLEPRAAHSYVNVQINNQHRLSNQSYESGVSSRQSYHSTSSSSVGSLDRLEETGHSSQINVAELFQAGMPDHEVMRAWLRDLRFEEYHSNFMQAGYDMPTISRMTPEDLTAIGITKPGHRKRLKAEIARLNIHDGIPEHIPNDVLEWLRFLNLEHYYNTLGKQGYRDIESLTDITWEDLEEIGVQKLGHQKKIMLAIERLKRIISGTKRISTIDGQTHRSSAEFLESLENNNSRWSGGEVMSMSYNQETHSVPVIARKSSSGDSLNTNGSGEYRSFRHHSSSSLDSGNLQHSPKSLKPDVVAIQVKRQSSHSGSGTIYAEAKDMGGMPITYQSFQGPSERKTPDDLDREATPTGDDFQQLAPRSPCQMAPVAPRAIIKPKPVAKIIAKSKRTSRENSPDIIDIEKHETEKNQDLCKSSPQSNNVFFPSGNEGVKRQSSEHIYAQPSIHSPKLHDSYIMPKVSSMSQSVPTGSVTPISVSSHDSSLHQSVPSPSYKTKKVAPPPPPKRTNSISHKSDLNKEDMSQFAGSMPKSALQTSQPQQVKSTDQCMPQNAFANCVQSLSQKFGRKRLESEESPSSDGEEFPPPPPPMAMDIITPKIHNYGIPSKSDKNGMGSEYRLPCKPKHENNSVGANSPVHSVEDTFGVKLRSSQVSTSTTTAVTSSPVSHSQTVVSSQTVINHSVPNSRSVPVHHECVMHAQEKVKMDTDKTKDKNHVEQTMKKAEVKRNDSLSSIDSNTLPFANENVGTIKQRTPTTKPSVVDIMEDTHRQHNLNSISHVHENGSATMIRQWPDVAPTKIVTANKTVLSHTGQSKPVQKVKAKPMVPQKPNMVIDSQDKISKGQVQDGDVLNDIDSMLQGLTDELDAMLEEELQVGPE